MLKDSGDAYGPGYCGVPCCSPNSFPPVVSLALEYLLRNMRKRLSGEFLQELGAAIEVELADEGSRHAAFAPVLALGKVLPKCVARHVGQVRHRDPLQPPPSRNRRATT